MGRKLAIGDEAVVKIALEAVLEQAYQRGGQDFAGSRDIAEAVLEQAERVQYQPSTRRMVLTFDLSGPADSGDEPTP